MEDIRYDGKVAIITGAGGALGRSYAMLLAARGAKVVVNDLKFDDNAPADKTVEEIKAAGGEAVANYDSVTGGDKIVQTAMDAFGRVDIVINNAGIIRDVSFHKMTEEQWQEVMNVHLQGSYSVTKAAWPLLREQQYGRVVMTTSAAGLYGNFGQANYSAAKMGIVGFGFTLAAEGAKRNIMVNTIAPIAGSQLTRTVLPPDICAMLKPEYVASLVAYLCSEQCDVTGGVFEAGAGTFSRVKWLRSPGIALPLSEDVSIEKVADNWDKINDMTDGKFISSLNESSMMTLSNLSSVK